MQRGDSESGKCWPGIRFSLEVGGDQEAEVMCFAVVIDSKSDLEVVCLGLESKGKPQDPSVGEGMAKLVSGEADFGFFVSL